MKGLASQWYSTVVLINSCSILLDVYVPNAAFGYPCYIIGIVSQSRYKLLGLCEYNSSCNMLYRTYSLLYPHCYNKKHHIHTTVKCIQLPTSHYIVGKQPTELDSSPHYSKFDLKERLSWSSQLQLAGHSDFWRSLFYLQKSRTFPTHICSLGPTPLRQMIELHAFSPMQVIPVYNKRGNLISNRTYMSEALSSLLRVSVTTWASLRTLTLLMSSPGSLESCSLFHILCHYISMVLHKTVPKF